MTVETFPDRCYRLVKAIKRYKRMGWGVDALCRSLSAQDAALARESWEAIRA